MKFNIEENSFETTVSVSGKIEGVNGIKLSKTLETLVNTEGKVVVLEMSSVTFIDSPGLGGLIYSSRVLGKKDKKLILDGPREEILELFRDCSVNDIFEIRN